MSLESVRAFFAANAAVKIAPERLAELMAAIWLDVCR